MSGENDYGVKGGESGKCGDLNFNYAWIRKIENSNMKYFSHPIGNIWAWLKFLQK